MSRQSGDHYATITFGCDAEVIIDPEIDAGIPELYADSLAIVCPNSSVVLLADEILRTTAAASKPMATQRSTPGLYQYGAVNASDCQVFAPAAAAGALEATAVYVAAAASASVTTTRSAVRRDIAPFAATLDQK